MIFLRNRLFLYLEKSLVTMDMQSSLFISLRVWGTQTPSLFAFSIFFKWQKIVDWDVFRSSANFQVLFSCISLIFLKHFDQDLMSILVWVHLSLTYLWNILWKHVLDLVVSNVTLVIYAKNFLSFFCCVFVVAKLPQLYVSNISFQFLHFRGVR